MRNFKKKVKFLRFIELIVYEIYFSFECRFGHIFMENESQIVYLIVRNLFRNDFNHFYRNDFNHFYS